LAIFGTADYFGRVPKNDFFHFLYQKQIQIIFITTRPLAAV
jgi:hypothetical protein